jgi:hypothetical protein
MKEERNVDERQQFEAIKKQEIAGSIIYTVPDVMHSQEKLSISL